MLGEKLFDAGNNLYSQCANGYPQGLNIYSKRLNGYSRGANGVIAPFLPSFPSVGIAG